MNSEHWAFSAANRIADQCIQHRNYCRAMESIFNALSIAQPGEVVVVVGPSRVGKSRAVEQAASRLARPREDRRDMPCVFVQAENASTLGSFSTKAFTQAMCRSIEHPIYGKAEPDDPWGLRISARVNRTPEGLLRDAVEQGLKMLCTRFLIVDEAHHVGYAGRRGSNALAVLDSWKCLAYNTNTVLCLVGSYQLLSILAHAPHLLGRQRLIEFPRYKENGEGDIIAFTEAVGALNEVIVCKHKLRSLTCWTRLLFTHSLGCIGHLTRWLMSALGEAITDGVDSISERLLLATRHPASQEAAIAQEIERGEHAMGHLDSTVPKAPPSEAPRKGGRPFQRKTRRFALNGRT